MAKGFPVVKAQLEVTAPIWFYWAQRQSIMRNISSTKVNRDLVALEELAAQADPPAPADKRETARISVVPAWLVILANLDHRETPARTARTAQRLESSNSNNMPPKKQSTNGTTEQSEKPAPGDQSPRGFLDYLGTYINGWVAAALVLPTAITWKGMPIFEDQRGILTTYTALSCALILAFLFSSRDLIPKFKTRIGQARSILIPFILICATAYCGYKYFTLFNDAIYYAKPSYSDPVKTVSMGEIHDGTSLIAYYILTMVFAECAFFFMAFREWRR